MLFSATPAKLPWVWTIAPRYEEDRSPTHGYAATLEAATQAFARSWHRKWSSSDAYLGLCYMLVQTHPRPALGALGQGVAALHSSLAQRPNAEMAAAVESQGRCGAFVGPTARDLENYGCRTR
jgi:hypothetical protein